MNNEDGKSAQLELSQLFEKASEAPGDLQMARMLANARAIPVESRARRSRWVWFPLGGSALLAAAAAGFWILDLREVRSGSDVGAQSASAGLVPSSTEGEVGARAAPKPLGVAGVELANSEEAGAHQNGSDEEADTHRNGSDAENGDGLAAADEEVFGVEHVWAITGADASLLVVEDGTDDAELGRGMGAEDLYGPLSEEDVDLWMLATNDLLGGG